MDSQRAGANLATSGAILGLLALAIGQLEPNTTPTMLLALICLCVGMIVLVRDAIPAVRESRNAVRNLRENYAANGTFRNK